MAEATQLMYSHKELTALLLRDQDIHEGLYDLALEFQLAVGAVGPQPDAAVPGVMVGVARIGLNKAPQKGPHTVDAAEVNPLPG
jgi:hypothetical protein